MSNLPKDPKPNISEGNPSLKTHATHNFDYDKVMGKMINIVRKNKQLVEKKNTASKNETLY